LKFSQKMNFTLSVLLISVAAFSALAHELETLDISGSTSISTLLNETSKSPVCVNPQPIEQTVGKMLLTEQKVEITEDLNSADALVAMKQLNSYVNKHVKEKTYYKITKVIKAEKCNAPESNIHVLEIEIRKTTCKRKDLEEGESDDKCHVRTGAEVVDCLWTGRLIGTTVAESQGLICSYGPYNFFKQNEFLCPLLKYDDTDMRRVDISSRHWKWENKLFAYAPPDFSAEFEDIPYDDFDPSEYKSLAKFNKMDQSVDRRSINGHYKVRNGRPLCPIGRTGLQGRGKLPRWGPNFVLAVVVDSGVGHVVDILSTTTAEGPFSIPTFFIDDYSKEGIEAKLEEIIIASKPTNGFSRMEIHSLVKTAMKNALIVKQGFTPDSRNTDNAWTETIAVQISDPMKQHIGKLKFESQAKHNTVEWRTVDEKSQSELRNYVERSIGEARFNEVVNKSDMKSSLKNIITALTGYTLRGLRFIGGVSSECGEEAIESLALVYKPVQQDSKRVLGIACQGAIVPGRHQNYTDTVLVSSYCIVEDPQEGYVVSVGSPDPHGDLQSSAQQFRAQRILNFPFEQHPVGILKTPQPIMYSDSVKPMCIAEAPLPDEHVCILGVVTKGGLMTLRHVQMLYESDCQELAQGLSSYLCAKVKEIDAEVGETFGLDPSLDIYPFVAPLEFDISGVQSGSLETPLFCLTNEHPTWSVYGFAMNAYDVTDPESPILFSDVSSDLKAIKQHSDVTYQEWVQSINTKHNDLKLSQKMNTIFSIFLISVGAISALAQELETLDISESTPILTPFNETTESLVCDNEQSMTRTVRKILLTEQKVEITEDINPMDALFVMKQLNSYVNKHVKGKTYYKMTRVIKAEKCNAPESDIHLKEGESDEKCKIRTGAEVVDCIWTGRLTRTTVVESQGLICRHYNFFMVKESLCPLLKYDDTDMRRVLLSEMHLQWDDKMLAYAPPEFSAEFNDFPHDNFDPSENKSLAQFNKMDHSVDRRSMIRPYKVKNGRPLCPIGRTGFQGRGKHPRWGPNFVLAVIVDSKAGIEAKLKEIIITSKPTNGFSEEEIHSLVKMAMKDALLVKMGFVPDARNTDNAWAEAIAVQISDPKQQHIETKSGTVEWRMLDEESQSDLRKYVQRYIEKNKLTEINKSSKKAFLGRVLTFMKKHILAAYFSTWIVLVGAAAFSLCTGIFAPTIALVAVEVGLFILAIILQQKVKSN
ncbi:ADP-ribose pyrophosphatase, mitochondrial, partial [Trichinella britovi]